uniref:Uncharacterized protein n=1 Tax=Meloidogyne enterolobii TaxID=390850 RepID=A0A6V7VLZ5_MELEN|nr:unnamed protein product [Meloidogyne enterolobii]
MFKFFEENAMEVLNKFDLSGDNLAHKGVKKANMVISYYNSLIEQRDIDKLSEIEEYDDEAKADFILERINDFSRTIENEKYLDFLDNYNLNTEDYEEKKYNLMK